MPIDTADRLRALASLLQSQHRALGAVVCLMVIPLLPFLLAGLEDGGPSARARGIATRIARLCLLVYGGTYVAIMMSNVVHPGEWDFPISWLNGYVGAHRLNFYEPDSYRRLAGALPAITPGLLKHVISVGFHFPPPSIFLFLPLGFFDIHTAYFLWYLFMIGIAVLDVVLLSRLFLGGTPQGTLHFGVVVSNAALEHDSRSWLTIAEMRRVLCPGGLMAIGVPAFTDLPGEGRVHAWLGWLSKVLGERAAGLASATLTFKIHDAPGDFYRFSPQTVRDVFFDGFENVTMQLVMIPPRLVGAGTKPRQTA